MRILFVTQESGKVPSGVITVMSELCCAWPESDSIVVLTNRKHWAHQHLSDILKKRTDSFVSLTPLFLRGDLPRFMRVFSPLLSPMYCLLIAIWMRRHRIEGVLSHNGGWPGGELNRLSIYAAWLAGIKRRYLVIHNTPNVPKSQISSLLFRVKSWSMARLSSRIITVSNACAQTLLDESGFGVDLQVIYNGIDITSVNRGAANIKNDKILTVGFVGELDARKGVHVLIESLHKEKSPCKLIFVGNGGKAYTDELILASNSAPWEVEFLGFRNDLHNLYPLLDVVVLPSLEFESFGMVLVEAMQYSIPAICSDFGGMKEVVEHNKSGLVVSAGDSSSLAEALNKMLGDKNLRLKMGVEGNRRLKSHFSSSIMTENYFALFHDSK